ncbi:hypothetical protein OH76DRAFT_1410827 [Lentinus brumalis]|uniref:DUF4139 domain-containing protein n=1 Tax=Lentinus brumalis TaxID=2498619 RepID=A0A371CR44_9APHY|nr:hypothetical protein OH76DRAFT_1410827 [Polyporus brumalis]
MGLRWSSVITLQAADHPIKSVTIFHSDTGTAEITRTFPVGLQSGKNVVNIRGISSCIDPDSLRLHVPSAPNVRVSDICCNTEQIAAKRNALVAERTLRQREYDRLVDTAARLHVSHAHSQNSSLRHSVLEATVKTTTATAPDAPGTKVGREYYELLDTLAQRMHSVSQVLHTLDRQILELERELVVPVESRKGDGSTIITATIVAEGECEVVLQLTYLVTGARWELRYDLHARTSNGRPSPDVSFHQYAKITQSTGEDWKDTEITLSASSSQSLCGLYVPSLENLQASPKRANPQSTLPRRMSPTHMQPLARGRPLVPPPGAGLFHLQATASPKPEAGTEPRTSAQTTPDDSAYVHVSLQGPSIDPVVHAVLSSEPVRQHHAAHPAYLAHVHDHGPSPSVFVHLVYRVGQGEAVCLPSDGLAHTVPIATLQLRADLEYVCVPRKSTAVFTQVRITNTSERDMLPGPVSVFMDDSFVTRTTLQHVGVNETFECVLGIDARIKVSSQQWSHGEAAHNCTDTAQTTVYTSVITLMNGHDVDVARLVIRDALPLGDEREKTNVTLRKPLGLAQAKDGDNVALALDTDVGPFNSVKVRWMKTKDGSAGKEYGMYEWMCCIPAGTKLALEAEWVVTGSSNVERREAP